MSICQFFSIFVKNNVYMKKLFLFLAVSSALAAGAQQNINLPVPKKSPVIDGANNVSFSLKAPKAQSVVLNGHFPSAPVDMTLSDSVWSANLENLPSAFYDYWFEVDGVHTLDPSNPYVVRDVALLSNFFVVPGEKGDLFLSQDVPHGSLEKVWYSSPILGGERRMSVYTPPGYDPANQKYPVLYLLHGMGGDEDAWVDLGRAVQVFDNLIASGQAVPMIVVMPNGNALRKAAPGMTGDGLYIPEGKHSVDPGLDFEKSFPEIIDFVESNYSVDKSKDKRAIAGLSMGGGHSWRISMNMPEMFDYVGLFSPAVRWNGAGVDESNPDEKLISQLERQFADPAKYYLIAIGKDDFLLPVNDSYRALLDRYGYPYTYLESQGGHSWDNWRDYLIGFLPVLFK